MPLGPTSHEVLLQMQLRLPRQESSVTFIAGISLCIKVDFIVPSTGFRGEKEQLLDTLKVLGLPAY